MPEGLFSLLACVIGSRLSDPSLCGCTIGSSSSCSGVPLRIEYRWEVTSFFFPNLKRERPESEWCDPEEIGIYPEGAGVASLVEAGELDDPVWAALAAVRPLGELSVLLGWGPGLEAHLLFVISDWCVRSSCLGGALRCSNWIAGCESVSLLRER